MPPDNAYDRVGAANAVVTTGDPYWVYWIFTKDMETGVMRIYRDGVQIAQATGRTRRYYGADQVQLGANRSATDVLGQFFNGLIDDLRIYNYAMDEVEAAYLYYDATGQSVASTMRTRLWPVRLQRKLQDRFARFRRAGGQLAVLRAGSGVCRASLIRRNREE